jgi:cytochrome P450
VRDDVRTILYADMTPELRAMIAYEGNQALDHECPYRDFAKVRAESPVVRWEQGVGFFKMADIVAAGNHPHLVSTEPHTGESYGMGSVEPLIPLHIDGDIHRRYRRLIDPLLAPRKVALLEDGFRKMTDHIIDGFIERGQVEFFSEFADPLPARMFMQLFGAPEEDLKFFVQKKDEILKAEGTTLPEREMKGRVAGNQLRDRLREIVAERRAAPEPSNDLISEFLTWELDGDRLSDDDVINVMHLFVIAGLDTVASSISCIIAWLAKHPNERRQVMDQPSLVAPMVEELMRLESPVPSSGVRWATEDIEINGVPVKQHEMVYLAWASGNIDPEVFPDPLQVKFDRESNRHIAFAAGRHRCLGSHLARLELRCAIDQFHRRVRDYAVAPGEEVGYKFEGVRHASYLPLVFSARP